MMATATMDWAQESLGKYDYDHDSDAYGYGYEDCPTQRTWSNPVLYDLPWISSIDLNNIIKEDYDGQPEAITWNNNDDSPVKMEPWTYSSVKLEPWTADWKNTDLKYYDLIKCMDEKEDADLKLLVSPTTLHPVEEDVIISDSISKPYSPLMDHDYCAQAPSDTDDVASSPPAEEVKKTVEVKQNKIVDDPVVEVWEIDSFNPQPCSSKSIPNQFSENSQTFGRETRRTSTRAADLKRKEQERKMCNAVHAVLKADNKVQRRKPYNRPLKPKNSVETTPSQSDIEEWSGARQAQKETQRKKKTTKGRIDHSESERQRREVLRENFAQLSYLVPNQYLRGEKASSQISKQKILNGAKAYISVLHSKNRSCRSLCRKNRRVRREIAELLMIYKIARKQK